MKIKVVIHQAEEGGYWQKFQQFLVVLLKVKAGKNLLRIYMKQ